MLYLKKENNSRVSDIRRAFEESIAVLGENAKLAMMHELAIQAGVHFDEPSISIVKLYEGLLMLYGKDTAEIIMEEVILKIDRIAEEKEAEK